MVRDAARQETQALELLAGANALLHGLARRLGLHLVGHVADGARGAGYRAVRRELEAPAIRQPAVRPSAARKR